MDDLSTLTPARRWRWVAPLAVLLLCLTFFLAGMAVDHFLPAAPAAGGTETTGLDAALLDEARRVIQENFVDRDAATDEQLQTGALAGMVDILGDVGHSRFMTPVMVEEQANYIAGEFEGIGAYVEMRDGFVTIVSPIDNSPAQAGGLLPGDIVSAVEGGDVAGRSLQAVVELILGPAGSPVTLTIFRPETSEELTFTLERARIELQNVTWTLLPGTTIAQVRIAGFSERVGDDLAAAAVRHVGPGGRRRVRGGGGARPGGGAHRRHGRGRDRPHPRPAQQPRRTAQRGGQRRRPLPAR